MVVKRPVVDLWTNVPLLLSLRQEVVGVLPRTSIPSVARFIDLAVREKLDRLRVEFEEED